MLPNRPTFDGHLVLANLGQEAQTITPTLHCEFSDKLSTQTLPAFALEPETMRSLSLNQIPADQFTHAAEAICSAEIEITGVHGTLLGRYFGESSTFTYWLCAKLEAGLGHAYNPLYWNVEGDREPLLTVTYIQGHPSWRTVASDAWIDTNDYYQSGCYVNQFAVSSQQPSILPVTWNGGPFLWANQPGPRQASLHCRRSADQ